MSQPEQHQVFQALSRSRASLERAADLGDGLAAALWRNRLDTPSYSNPAHHTLTCYVENGWKTYRRDRPHQGGHPNALCTLPAGQDSAWVINGDFRFIHLYISPEQFALGAVTLLDREPRELQLREGTFFDDPLQAARFHALTRLDWSEPGERLLTSSLAHELLDHTLLSQVGRRDGLRLKGGLAPIQSKRLRDFIDNHLAEPLSLGQLAGLAALSEYHFARMFRTSFGMPPHRYVLARRLARARQLLAHTDLPLGDIALACGFASASHFSNRFRAAHGGTPGQYRAALRH